MTDTPEQDLQTLKQAVDGQHVAMLTTVDDRGLLVSKPMHLLEQDTQGHFWFFCQVPAADTDPSRRFRNANLAFSKAGASRYVSVSCRGEVLRDRARIHALWTAMAKPWFPDGPDSPDLACLRLVPVQGEVWDGPGNGLSQALAVAASIVAGRPVGMGEHHMLGDLDQPGRAGGAWSA